MRFLSDESVDSAVTLALRSAGHDVRAAAEEMGGADDAVLVAAAADDDRLLITKDRDFGQLVFAQGQPTAGVIYVRWPVVAREQLAARPVALVAEMGPRLAAAFVVVRPGRVRVRSRLKP